MCRKFRNSCSHLVTLGERAFCKSCTVCSGSDSLGQSCCIIVCSHEGRCNVCGEAGGGVRTVVP